MYYNRKNELVQYIVRSEILVNKVNEAFNENH